MEKTAKSACLFFSVESIHPRLSISEESFFAALSAAFSFFDVQATLLHDLTIFGNFPFQNFVLNQHFNFGNSQSESSKFRPENF